MGASDPITRARACVARASVAIAGDLELPRDERERLRETAREVFEAAGHEIGLAEYWMAVANEGWFAARAAESADAAERALAHLERAGASESRLGYLARGRLLSSSEYSPLPIDQALERAERMQGTSPLVDARRQMTIGRLLAMKGEVERGRELFAAGRRVFLEADLPVTVGGFAIGGSVIESDAGNFDAAEAMIREGLEQLERMGDKSYYSTLAVMLAHVLLNQRRFAEVSQWLDRSRATTGADDIVNFVFIGFVWNTALLADEGRYAEAEAAGRRATELAETIDYVYARPIAQLVLRGDARAGGKARRGSRARRDRDGDPRREGQRDAGRPPAGAARAVGVEA